MSLRWPPVGIALVCPRCKHRLEETEVQLQCLVCAARYEVLASGAPCLLSVSPERENGAAARKDEVKRMFTAFHQALEENGLSRFCKFINWGYAAEEDTASVLTAGVNHNSIRLLKEILNGLDLTGMDILEVACGRGGNVRELFKSWSPRSVVGLDLTEANIAFCQTNNRHPHSYFFVGDAEELPIGTECCDIVLNVESSDLYPHIDSFYMEVYRVLKPGGMFVYADDLAAEKFEEGERYLRNLGFELQQSRDITDNALRSSDLALRNRLAAFGGSDRMNEEIISTMGVPGTPIYDDMRSGKRKYKILHFRKPASHDA
ncbi:class I SAM-dependent methyltransferase [Cohnella sp. CFH 77786]|uniref:class I SAM-dependent methyltransferase n=1 Tax=Cohnella sp. CFH 77786 TaxID=2662265 RepID=UPI001C60A9B5|nr:class I SAM-dependent methyltransferase [Cohnella sp. CFH 77786]